MKKTKRIGYKCPVCAGTAKALLTCPRCLQEQCPTCRGKLPYCADCDADVRLRASTNGILPRKGAAVCSCNCQNPAWDKCVAHAPRLTAEADCRDTAGAASNYQI